jgi:3-phenylpropionate/trans-cinnamate dioxygenase ferredoxin reductase subunit
MADESAGIVIVGAGHAGGTVAALLRQYGVEAPISLIGEEPAAPYQRPPLSKAWLKGDADLDGVMLKPESFYAEHGIVLRTGVQVQALDRAAGRVVLQGGETLAYRNLILATGARARPLPAPGADLPGVLALRTLADAEALRGQLAPGVRVAVIGGGYVGLEAAASARALGAEVTVIERERRLLARVACATLSAFFQSLHERHGAHFVLAASVVGVEGEGRVQGVRLADGRLIPCDVALVGVGALPNQELAQAAGLDCDDGVRVDLDARTSDPAIFAIGDCTRRPMPLYDREWRLESVPNALEQAKAAASALSGRPRPAPEVPWFWSDQYDVKLQIAGLPLDVDQVVVRGAPEDGRFAVFHLNGAGRVMAVEAVNAAPEFMGGRQLIAAKKAVAPDALRDMSLTMKVLAAS